MEITLGDIADLKEVEPLSSLLGLDSLEQASPHIAIAQKAFSDITVRQDGTKYISRTELRAPTEASGKVEDEYREIFIDNTASNVKDLGKKVFALVSYGDTAALKKILTYANEAQIKIPAEFLGEMLVRAVYYNMIVKAANILSYAKKAEIKIPAEFLGQALNKAVSTRRKKGVKTILSYAKGAQIHLDLAKALGKAAVAAACHGDIGAVNAIILYNNSCAPKIHLALAEALAKMPPENPICSMTLRKASCFIAYAKKAGIKIPGDALGKAILNACCHCEMIAVKVSIDYASSFEPKIKIPGDALGKAVSIAVSCGNVDAVKEFIAYAKEAQIKIPGDAIGKAVSIAASSGKVDVVKDAIAYASSFEPKIKISADYLGKALTDTP
ncbi:MAG: hypothetical protein HN411_04305 [Waddliaceae bacterium]|jgi:hypothetical protein|nr:hypothetical protein [Waddliaceae bacterium]MBT3578820.1 hypothetical protein [Waddliaceae bacterium]MBT4445303.1 hypothetical protein [Waddliaceae bacterium]MBT6928775.1 hypothetical protein [Waddliaceae bacterium]MBT7263866.1 hypothetical protein [Waddliaceae bacterium]